MPPHCDTLDGPVVTAARRALEAGDPALVLPYVPKAGEGEVREAFAKAAALRGESPAARELAERWFFENVVRIHRAGEGAPYEGLKPAGLDEGPVIPVAEHAVETGEPNELIAALAGIVEHEVRHRLAHVKKLEASADGDVDAGREYVEAMLGLEIWAHSLYVAAHAEAHAHGHAH